MPENVFGGPFGGGAASSVMHPLVIVAMLISVMLVSTLPIKKTSVPFLLVIFLVPRGQQIYVAGMHWYVSRILILTGCVRMARGKLRVAGGLNVLDKAFLGYVLYGGICPVLQLPEIGMVIFQASTLVDTLGCYFFLRYTFQDESSIVIAAKTLATITAILCMFMLYEKTHNINLFGYLGGAPIAPQVRDGQIRAQATFGHPILAGAFAATLMPLFYWLWKSGKSATFAVLGLVGSTVMVLTSASSTPVLSYCAGGLSLALWPVRRFMRVVRWGIVLVLAGFGMVMNAPVWFIVAHVNVIGGSGGYDRAYLIDVFIRHFKDWWLIGTTDFGSWGLYMWDLSNQFVEKGETGGLVTFVCFIATISLSFSRLAKTRNLVGRKQQWLCWSLGAVMLSHVFAYFGVAYWDQTKVWWLAFLAMVSTATVGLQARSSEADPTHPPEDAISQPTDRTSPRSAGASYSESWWTEPGRTADHGNRKAS